MRAWFSRSVRAITETVLRELNSTVPAADVERVAMFVHDQQARMPDYLRFPVVLLTFLFDVWPLLQGRDRPYHCQPLAVRRQQMETWKRSRLAICRNLMKLFESLVVFQFISDSHEWPLPENSDVSR